MPLLSKKPASSQTFPDLGIPKRVNSSGRWYYARLAELIEKKLAAGCGPTTAANMASSSSRRQGLDSRGRPGTLPAGRAAQPVGGMIGREPVTPQVGVERCPPRLP